MLAPSIRALRQAKEVGKRDYKYSQGTRKKYDGFVVRMRVWASSFGPVDDSEGSVVDTLPEMEGLPESERHPLGMDPEFREAFTGRPKECSPEALALYITLKCLHGDCGLSTADGAYSAMKLYWNEL